MNATSRFRIALLGAVFLLGRDADARVWYVTPDGTGDAPTIQAAIDSAQAGDEVRLAPGEYTSASQGSVGPNFLHLRPGITLRGEAGAALTTIASTTRAIRLVETGSATRIEGLTIRGTTNYLDPDGAKGAGLYVLGSGAPTVVDCVFRNCQATGVNLTAGGAIACEATVQPYVVGCAFEACGTFDGVGGAISCNTATIRRCRFIGNRAYYSGGAISSGAATIDSCEFFDNVAAGDPGGSGGAISGSGARVSNCRFENNVSGGPFAGGGGAVSAAIYVVDCVFSANRTSALPGARGGALSLAEGGTVLRCVFAGNSAQFGGALAMSSGTVAECVFASNAAGGSTESTGGAIAARGPALIESCTFVANRCTPLTNAGAISAASGATIRRCIIAGTEGAVCDAGLAATWSCSALFGNSGGDTICGSDGGGNFSADPLFCAADPAGSLDVTIQSASPCAPGNHPGGETCGLIGAGPVACGSVGVAPLSWTRLKELFR